MTKRQTTTKRMDWIGRCWEMQENEPTRYKRHYCRTGGVAGALWTYWLSAPCPSGCCWLTRLCSLKRAFASPSGRCALRCDASFRRGWRRGEGEAEERQRRGRRRRESRSDRQICEREKGWEKQRVAGPGDKFQPILCAREGSSDRHGGQPGTRLGQTCFCVDSAQ